MAGREAAKPRGRSKNMDIHKKIIRGLQDLRTLSGRVDRLSSPYRAYLRIACLEMEKARRGKERSSAMQRVQSIDARFNDINAEKDELLQSLGERNNSSSTNSHDTDPKPGHRRSTGGFRYRY